MKPRASALIVSISLCLSQAAFLQTCFAQTPGSAPTKVTSVEGITEYRLDNGLKVLLFPDSSKPTVTVNVTYLVGSRYEGYGETRHGAPAGAHAVQGHGQARRHHGRADPSTARSSTAPLPTTAPTISRP